MVELEKIAKNNNIDFKNLVEPLPVQRVKKILNIEQYNNLKKYIEIQEGKKYIELKYQS